jgi:hypothetical protein
MCAVARSRHAFSNAKVPEMPGELPINSASSDQIVDTLCRNRRHLASRRRILIGNRILCGLRRRRPAPCRLRVATMGGRDQSPIRVTTVNAVSDQVASDGPNISSSLSPSGPGIRSTSCQVNWTGQAVPCRIGNDRLNMIGNRSGPADHYDSMIPRCNDEIIQPLPTMRFHVQMSNYIGNHSSAKTQFHAPPAPENI